MQLYAYAPEVAVSLFHEFKPPHGEEVETVKGWCGLKVTWGFPKVTEMDGEINSIKVTVSWQGFWFASDFFRHWFGFWGKPCKVYGVYGQRVKISIEKPLMLAFISKEIKL